MKLPKAVLDVVRGAGGAAVALAIGCSSHGNIQQEPAAQLQPLVATPPAVQLAPPPPPPAVATTPTVVAVPTPPPTPATLTALPPSPVVEDAGTGSVATTKAPRRHRHGGHTDPQPPDPNGLNTLGYGGIGGHWHNGVNPACGRG